MRVHVYKLHGIFTHAWAVIHIYFHLLLSICIGMLDHGISVHLIHTRLIHHLRVSNLRRILITKHLGLGQILNGIASLETFLNWCVCRTHIKIAI